MCSVVCGLLLFPQRPSPAITYGKTPQNLLASHIIIDACLDARCHQNKGQSTSNAEPFAPFKAYLLLSVLLRQRHKADTGVLAHNVHSQLGRGAWAQSVRAAVTELQVPPSLGQRISARRVHKVEPAHRHPRPPPSDRPEAIRNMGALFVCFILIFFSLFFFFFRAFMSLMLYPTAFVR